MNGTKRTVSSLTATAGRNRRLRHVVMLAASALVLCSCGSNRGNTVQTAASAGTLPSVSFTSPAAPDGSETTAPYPPASTTVPVAVPSAARTLEGRWSTGPIPIDQIRETMLQAGVAEALVDEWVLEVGSPTEYTFDLEFRGDNFLHFSATPQSPRQVDESGTFVYTDGQLDLDIVDAGDAYRFAADESNDHLQLRFIDSTETGTEEDKANHARFTIALYTSGQFLREP